MIDFASPTLRLRCLLVLVVAACGTSQSLAQRTYAVDPYRHTYDAEHGYIPHASVYGGGLYGGAVGGVGAINAGAGVAAAGVGDMAAGVGQMHLSNAQAQEAHQTATTQYLQNLGLAQKTSLEIASEREKTTQARMQAGIEAGRQQVAQYNKALENMAAAHRLTAEQFDRSGGVLHWPFVLRGPDYAEQRETIDKLFDARTPEDSGAGSSSYDGIQKACDQLQEKVAAAVKAGMTPMDFVTAKHFISSVAYESRFPVKTTK